MWHDSEFAGKRVVLVPGTSMAEIAHKRDLHASHNLGSEKIDTTPFSLLFGAFSA
jgi:hypothetical protein